MQLTVMIGFAGSMVWALMCVKLAFGEFKSLVQSAQYKCRHEFFWWKKLLKVVNGESMISHHLSTPENVTVVEGGVALR